MPQQICSQPSNVHIGEQRFDCAVVHSIPGRVRLRLSPNSAQAISVLMSILGAQTEVSSIRWVPEARSLTVAFDSTISFGDLAARLPGMVLEAQPTDAMATRLDSVLVASVSIVAAAAGLGMAVQIAVILLSNAGAPKGLVDINPVDAIDAAVALLRGDVAGALLSLALILFGATLWAWLFERSRLRDTRNVGGRRLLARAA